MPKRAVIGSLFILFVLTQAAYLHRVPGLMGDEASEGENVYELWAGEKSYFEGERSYIGPVIDYVRMPFFAVINHPVLALRSVTFLAALASFWLAMSVLPRIFGEDVGIWAAVALLFSPVFMLEERMAWTISLTPFFGLLALYLIMLVPRKVAARPRGALAVLAGAAAGLGLSNHILFLPVLAGLVGAGLLYWVSGPVKSRRWRDHGATALLSAVGFAAAFATQAWQLLYSTAGDQGEPEAVAELFWDRLHDFPKLLPLLISGSSYVARYTGVEFSATWQYVVTVIVLGLVGIAVLVPRKVAPRPRGAAALWLLGVVIQLAVLLVLVDRFSLRYFVPTILGLWVLAGVGMGVLFRSFGPVKSLRDHGVPLALAGVLTTWIVVAVLVPFLKTGGSTNDFSLANRTDSAAALLDARPLVDCLRGKGTVTSESVHIFNRLWFWRHYEPQLQIVPEGEDAQWLVNYRAAQPSHEATAGEAGTLCPELTHFRIEKR